MLNEFEKGVAALIASACIAWMAFTFWQMRLYEYRLNHIENDIEEIESVMTDGCRVAQ